MSRGQGPEASSSRRPHLQVLRSPRPKKKGRWVGRVLAPPLDRQEARAPGPALEGPGRVAAVVPVGHGQPTTPPPQLCGSLGLEDISHLKVRAVGGPAGP